ncbi:MAG: C1 family peptidase [Bacteroidales bacterium]|nr:C1 family peptidase [Bacteroidales bacterium]
MKKTLLLLAVLAGFTAAAQTPGGGISAELLSELSASFENNASDKAIRNALNSTPINTLALSAENLAMIDTHFSDKVKTKGHTDQKSSGRCWLFTGLNVLRAKMIEKYDLGEFKFSQNYLFFYDQLEKSNLFLQGIIDTKDLPDDDQQVDWLFSHPIGDGGQFTGVSNLITKYGVVPEDVMPETYCANNTAQMRVQLSSKLREGGLRLRQKAASGKDLKGKKAQQLSDELQAMKVGYLKEIYRILSLCLGTPPTEFEWTRYNAKGEFVSRQTYTPKSFYDEFVGADLEGGYVMLMNDPCREYYKVYEIEYDRHVYDGDNWLYINLPVDKIKEMAIASIKDGTAMYFSCDVGKFFNRKKGVLDLENYDYDSLLGVKFGMDKKERVQTHASGSSHAMTLIAVDIQDGKPVKWMVENSWGATSGYKGNLIMTDKWFDEYMFRLVVEKKYVPADILSLLGQTPVKLPSWDPMFLPEE